MKDFNNISMTHGRNVLADKSRTLADTAFEINTLKDKKQPLIFVILNYDQTAFFLLFLDEL